MIEEQVLTLSFPYPERGERPVRVFIPAHEEGEKLPVIYMTDGQNLFDVESSGFGCWYTREAVREERQKSGLAAIIVGIHNVDPWRSNELMPKSIGPIQCPEEARPYLSPEGEVFDDFVVNTVKPFVEEYFPVKPGRAFTAFCGSSMGGLQSFFTVLLHPDLFSAAGVLSPAFLFYTEKDMRRWVHSVLREEKPFLYLFSGAADDLEKRIRQCTEWTAAILEDCYPKEKLKLVIQPEQRHHETAWTPIFKDFLHIFLSR